jgi:ribonuclease VapC
VSVLDTSAVLAIIYDEEGADRARHHARGGSISRVNVAEVLTDLIRSGYGSAAEARELFGRMPIQVRDVLDEHVGRVAELKQVRGLSLGDCFCIALGEAVGEPLITADQQWATLNLAVPVELIR